MTLPSELHTFADVQTLLASVDPDHRLVGCEIGDLRLGDDVVGTVLDAASSLVPHDDPADLVLLVDDVAIQHDGRDLKDLVETQLGERFRVRREVLRDGHAELHVTDPVVAAATAAVADAQVVVALGGGTVSDIGKLAVSRAGGRPLVVVQTAASVDGFTDNVSVLLRDGVKRTVPSCWPDVVISDATVIAAAPARMTRAGYGETVSMFTAPADWRLASLLGLDTTFHRGPIALLEAVGADIDSWSPGVGQGEPSSVQRLTWALAVRGIATGVAGTTACLSGVEHLVSHMLDLHHGERHLPMGLHGAQVGVASVVAAAAWEMCFDRLAAGGAVRVDPAALDPTAARRRVERTFADLNPSGRVTGECWNDYGAKLQAVASRQADVDAFLGGWTAHEPELRGLLKPSVVLAQGLRVSGAAAGFDELDPAVDPGLARWAVAGCSLMRNRFTVVDLLTLVGWWGDDDVDEVLDRAAQAVTAAVATEEPTRVR